MLSNADVAAISHFLYDNTAHASAKPWPIIEYPLRDVVVDGTWIGLEKVEGEPDISKMQESSKNAEWVLEHKDEITNVLSIVHIISNRRIVIGKKLGYGSYGEVWFGDVHVPGVTDPVGVVFKLQTASLPAVSETKGSIQFCRPWYIEPLVLHALNQVLPARFAYVVPRLFGTVLIPSPTIGGRFVNVIAMEYMPGKRLVGKLSNEQRLSVLWQLASFVFYTQQTINLTLNDLRSTNYFVDDGGTVRFFDFGSVSFTQGDGSHLISMTNAMDHGVGYDGGMHLMTEMDDSLLFRYKSVNPERKEWGSKKLGPIAYYATELARNAHYKDKTLFQRAMNNFREALRQVMAQLISDGDLAPNWTLPITLADVLMPGNRLTVLGLRAVVIVLQAGRPIPEVWLTALETLGLGTAWRLDEKTTQLLQDILSCTNERNDISKIDALAINNDTINLVFGSDAIEEEEIEGFIPNNETHGAVTAEVLAELQKDESWFPL